MVTRNAGIDFAGGALVYPGGKINPEDLTPETAAYCDGKNDEPKDLTTYENLYNMAVDLVYGDITVVDITEGATHYHADYVFPAWRKTKTKTIEIEDHIFYRWEQK